MGTAPSTDPIRRTALDVVARRLVVHAVEPLGAAMRRVRLGGPEVAGFRADGPTDHAKVYLPPTPDGDVPLPVRVDGRWVPRDGETLVCRDYTVRFDAAADGGAGEVVLDMAVHPHGPAGRWAAQARPGQQLGLLGPKTTKVPPLDRDWYVLAVDETGLPGLTNWLGMLPAGPRVVAVAQVGRPGDEVPLPDHPGVEVTWLHRGGDGEATDGARLVDAVAAARVDPAAPGWVWAAAEALEVRAVRRHVVDVLGLDKRSFQMTGYWRRGVADFDHKSPEATG